MTTLKGIHKGPMTVRLVCGGIIEGVIQTDDMLIGDVHRDVSWYLGGNFYHGVTCVLDIAEIISKPTQRTMKELYDSGELEVGMKFRSGRSGYTWDTFKTTEGLWLFSSTMEPVFYSIGAMSEPDQMILLEEDNT